MLDLKGGPKNIEYNLKSMNAILEVMLNNFVFCDDSHKKQLMERIFVQHILERGLPLNQLILHVAMIHKDIPLL
jgi:hypothetical protein